MQLLCLVYVFYKSTRLAGRHKSDTIIRQYIFEVNLDSRYTYVHHILNCNRYKCGFSGVNDKLSYNNARKSPL